MANSKQARKRIRQNETRRLLNKSQRSKMRTLIKNLRAAIAAQDADLAKTAFISAVSGIDKAVSKGLIHANTAARYKSRLNTRVKALVQQAA